MKIFKMANEQNVPEWSVKAEIASSKIKQVENAKINLTASNKVTDDIISEECNNIELCVSKNEPYYCNASWNNETISHLKEYASACGMLKNNFKLVKASDQVSIVKANTQTLIKSMASQAGKTKKDFYAILKQI